MKAVDDRTAAAAPTSRNRCFAILDSIGVLLERVCINVRLYQKFEVGLSQYIKSLNVAKVRGGLRAVERGLAGSWMSMFRIRLYR